MRGRRSRRQLPVPDPGERPLRGGRRRTATPTARSPTRPTSRATRRSAGRGRATISTRRASRRSCSTCSAMVGLALVGRRFGGRRLAATLAFAWAAYPFTQYVVELEHERRDPAGAADLRLLARDVAACARRLLRARGLDEVRPLLLAPLWATYPDARRPRTVLAYAAGFARRDARRVLDPAARAEPAARRPRLLGPDDPARRSAASRRSRSGTGGSTTPVCPTCTCSSTCWRAARRRGARRRLRAAAEVAAPARRAQRGAAARLRARAHALVLRLPRLVLPVRRLRRPLAGRRARAGAGDRAPWTPGPRAGHSRLTRAAPAVAALAAAAVFAVAWTVVHYGFYADNHIVDTPVYQRYGDAIVDGQVPYRDFTVEYPPACAARLRAAVADRLARRIAERVRRVFGFLMAICGGGAWWRSSRSRSSATGRRPARLAAGCALAALAPLALGSVVLTRFDLWPAALVAAALAALVAGRDRLALGALGLGIAAKVYPVVLLPIFVAFVWRRRGRREALRRARRRRRRRRRRACCRSSRSARTGSGRAACARRSRPLQIETLGVGDPARAPPGRRART